MLTPFRRWYARQGNATRGVLWMFLATPLLVVLIAGYVGAPHSSGSPAYHSSFDDGALRAADIDWQRAKAGGDSGRQAAARGTLNSVCVNVLAHPLTTSSGDRGFCRTYVAAVP